MLTNLISLLLSTAAASTLCFLLDRSLYGQRAQSPGADIGHHETSRAKNDMEVYHVPDVLSSKNVEPQAFRSAYALQRGLKEIEGIAVYRFLPLCSPSDAETKRLRSAYNP
ncbi:hypothetical protein CERZMDRAFT_87749 [Cercospora zeae-maydis SCOH1-5]|uniref:Uncharacterized protein n=1 Tax=Cercospora zeae-maydis SCOH1-5 TaxID=717836 RepID=A0A6A6F5B8_9PEZI|nr:hypothetical protein CERZMDRAFT_87749 [Cercospora zeae-maydis SCOH1-5]